MQISCALYEFLKTLKDGPITRRDVYSYPALYRLIDLGLIKFRSGATYCRDTYHLTDAGKQLLADAEEADSVLSQAR